MRKIEVQVKNVTKPDETQLENACSEEAFSGGRRGMGVIHTQLRHASDRDSSWFSVCVLVVCVTIAPADKPVTR